MTIGTIRNQKAALVLTLTLSSTGANAGSVLHLRVGQLQAQDQSIQLQELNLKSRASVRGFSHQHFIVQFERAPGEAQRSALEGFGFRVLRYLPDDAYLIAGPAENAGWLKEQIPQVSAVISYAGGMKVSPGLPRDSQLRLTVTLTSEQEKASVLENIRLLSGIEVLAASGSDVLVSARAEAVSKLAAIEGIEFIDEALTANTLMIEGDDEPTTAPSTLGSYTGYESGTRLMTLADPHARGLTGAGQIVAVADTGIDRGSISDITADLQGTILNGYSVGVGGTSWKDPNGHGTHVAGSVAGRGTLSNGRIQGSSPRASLYAVSLLTPDERMNFAENFEAMAKPTYAAGARIHTNSWGYRGHFGEYPSLSRQVDQFVWEHPDFLVLFAAGNDGIDADSDGRVDPGSIVAPGTAKNVLTVGASENRIEHGGRVGTVDELDPKKRRFPIDEPLRIGTMSDNPNGIAAFSARGPTLDGRLKPEIVAPGTQIVSIRSALIGEDGLFGKYADGYVYCSGTSMATPLAAGAAAVVRQHLIEERGLGQPSAALIKAVMMHTAKDLFPGQYGTGQDQEIPKKRPNIEEGYGRVDVQQAVSLPSSALLLDESLGLSADQVIEKSVSVGTGQGLHATLVYNDAPGAVSAAIALVNDLDLEVITPSGQVITPNDHINNTETVELASAAAGTYRVRVKGIRVAQGKAGKQPFALVASTPAL